MNRVADVKSLLELWRERMPRWAVTSVFWRVGGARQIRRVAKVRFLLPGGWGTGPVGGRFTGLLDKRKLKCERYLLSV
jgi:hypothetical protein